MPLNKGAKLILLHTQHSSVTKNKYTLFDSLYLGRHLKKKTGFNHKGQVEIY